MSENTFYIERNAQYRILFIQVFPYPKTPQEKKSPEKQNQDRASAGRRKRKVRRRIFLLKK
jgi:hypothetical protein